MKKVCIIGHFGFGDNMANGQTIKTKSVTTELENQLGVDQVIKIDTHGGVKVLPKIVFQMVNAFKKCKNIVILPAQNGIKVFVPLCNVLNKVFHRRLHYVVIGGWLNDFLDDNKYLEKKLRSFKGIYVETNAMRMVLIERGFCNIYIMPNFKNIKILSEAELIYRTSEPHKLCTFSRVMKEKGIGEAIDVVSFINEKYNRTVFTLDIYGQVDSEQIEWFENLKSSFPPYVSYKGLVPYDRSVEVLKEYYALLFPTYYAGEGFAGTLLDAMAAGVPAVASDWKYNSEIVIPGKTGYLFRTNDFKSFCDNVEKSLDDSWNKMKQTCIEEAGYYSPDKAISVLVNMF